MLMPSKWHFVAIRSNKNERKSQDFVYKVTFEANR